MAADKNDEDDKPKIGRNGPDSVFSSNPLINSQKDLLEEEHAARSGAIISDEEDEKKRKEKEDEHEHTNLLAEIAAESMEKVMEWIDHAVDLALDEEERECLETMNRAESEIRRLRVEEIQVGEQIAELEGLIAADRQELSDTHSEIGKNSRLTDHLNSYIEDFQNEAAKNSAIAIEQSRELATLMMQKEQAEAQALKNKGIDDPQSGTIAKDADGRFYYAQKGPDGKPSDEKHFFSDSDQEKLKSFGDKIDETKYKIDVANGEIDNAALQVRGAEKSIQELKDRIERKEEWAKKLEERIARNEGDKAALEEKLAKVRGKIAEQQKIYDESVQKLVDIDQMRKYKESPEYKDKLEKFAKGEITEDQFLENVPDSLRGKIQNSLHNSKPAHHAAIVQGIPASAERTGLSAAGSGIETQTALNDAFARAAAGVAAPAPVQRIQPTIPAPTDQEERRIAQAQPRPAGMGV